ncbi:ATP-binding protein [Oculatella sp. LEGE 06141]|uniref:ATP-binding protein n=1 Tax=Oculatella sp. LEGE 06141 TaxID=1828648 RepID=UPI0030D9A086
MLYAKQLQVTTDLAELSHVLGWFDQLEHDTIPAVIWMQCQTALAEAFTNAVRHAHKGRSPDTPIDIEVIVFNRQLELRVWDYGAVFDLEQKLADMPYVAASEPGGRGLMLIAHLSDHVSYLRSADNRNCLILTKSYLPVV